MIKTKKCLLEVETVRFELQWSVHIFKKFSFFRKVDECMSFYEP